MPSDGQYCGEGQQEAREEAADAGGAGCGYVRPSPGASSLELTPSTGPTRCASTELRRTRRWLCFANSPLTDSGSSFSRNATDELRILK